MYDPHQQITRKQVCQMLKCKRNHIDQQSRAGLLGRYSTEEERENGAGMFVFTREHVRTHRLYRNRRGKRLKVSPRIARHLHGMGITVSRIARLFGVDHKSVEKVLQDCF